MPETPDFEKIAQKWCYTQETDDVPEMDARRAEFVVVLKSIWNARGATDIAKVEIELSMVMGATKAGPYCKTLDRALRALDR
jgi:hypothetical protein